MLTERMRTIASRNLTGTIAAAVEYRMAPAAGPRAVPNKKTPGGGAGSRGCNASGTQLTLNRVSHRYVTRALLSN